MTIISEEAVAAAAHYLRERFFWNGALVNEVAREVLEASEPHMLVEQAARAGGITWPDIPRTPDARQA